MSDRVTERVLREDNIEDKTLFKCMLNLKAQYWKSELIKVSISNFVKFRLQSLISKIERAFEMITNFSIKKGQKGL